jgi:hypothetical protein
VARAAGSALPLAAELPASAEQTRAARHRNEGSRAAVPRCMQPRNCLYSTALVAGFAARERPLSLSPVLPRGSSPSFRAPSRESRFASPGPDGADCRGRRWPPGTLLGCGATLYRGPDAAQRTAALSTSAHS